MSHQRARNVDNNQASEMHPLDQRLISYNRNGVNEKISGLNKLWADLKYEWIPYRVPPRVEDLNVAGAAETWCERSCMIVSDLEFLLGLPHHKFWSQCVYDNRLHINLGQLIQRLPRQHDYEQLDQYPSTEIRSIVSNIMKKTFLVFLRLSTHKESKDFHITPSVFGKIIYDNFLFDVPRLMDICVLYYDENPSLVEKMVDNVIKQADGRYDNDIIQSAQTIKEALFKAQGKVDELVYQTPGLLANNSKTNQQLMDLALYSADILKSISAFIQAYPPAAKIFHTSHLHYFSDESNPSLLLAKKQNAAEAYLFGASSVSNSKPNNRSVEDMKTNLFESILSSFYDHSLIPMYRHVLKQKELGTLAPTSTELVLSRIQLARQSTICTFRSLLNHACLAPMLQGNGSDSRVSSPFSTSLPSELAEDCMLVLTTSLSEQHFFLDYSETHEIRDDLELIRQVGVELDPMRVQYLFDGINSLKSKSGDTEESMQSQGATCLNYESTSSSSHNPEPGPSKSSKSVEVDSLISQVKDLFPDLGEGFVLSCLEYFDFSPEQVINTLLEDNLPPHLASMDRKMVKQESMPSSSSSVPKDTNESTLISDITNTRSNIYDGDEFDINVRDKVDLSKIHRGKQRRAKNANAMLDDKKELKTQTMKDRFAALSIVVDEEYIVPGTSGGGYDYDDEYDDTYDDQAMGEREPDANELEVRRPFVLPQALGGGHITYVREESDHEDEHEQKNPLDFARNPEEVRQEAERKRQEKSRNWKGGNPPQRDVVGRAKGLGQDKHVKINRKHKTENQGKRTRAAADKKMSKGMF